jgi:NAD(P)-dependent dehydrogenase (short-subunit alcohol dehydrogenase family)
MSTNSEQVVLITGAGSGIGRQLALLLAQQGSRIAALDRQPELLEELKTQLAGKPLACAVADVTDPEAVRSAVAGLERELGPTGMLIASAGLGRGTPASAFRAEDINDMIRVNLIGVVNTLDAVLPGMRKRRAGHLVALSSLASYRGMPLMAGYSASKAGLNALMDSLRVELKRFGITVTTLCPGWISTPMTQALAVPGARMMSVEEAGRRILAAIRARKAFHAFPTGLVWQVRLLRYLPCRLADWLAGRYLAQAERALRA